MTWNAPATAVLKQLMTAAFWNAQVRDNFLETGTASVTTAGDIPFADDANSMGSRLPIGASGTQLGSDGTAPVWRDVAGMIGDATYTAAPAYPLAFTVFNNALWGTGTAVQVTLTTGTTVALWYGARYVAHPTLGSNVQLSYDVTGATTIAASNTWGTASESDPGGTLLSAGRGHVVSGLTPGSNTFRLVGLLSTGAAATVASPWIVAEAR